MSEDHMGEIRSQKSVKHRDLVLKLIRGSDLTHMIYITKLDYVGKSLFHAPKVKCASNQNYQRGRG